jgi:indolepyruvate ferredoxin oxidoreductase beta subunit
VKRVTNIVFAGLGGQGVLTATDILAHAAFHAGHDVKKSDIHGMAQRGGSVTSDLRYGDIVHSPMIPLGEANYVVVLESTQVVYASRWKHPDGLLLSPEIIDPAELPNKRSINIALLGALSPHLALDPQAIESALLGKLKPKLHDESIALFRAMRAKASRAS